MKFSFPYPLLADVNKDLINGFGVWGPKKFRGKEYEGIFVQPSSWMRKVWLNV